jgi:hypothetical protein
MNVSTQDQMLAQDTTPDCCEPVTKAMPFNDMKPQTQKTSGLCKQLQGVVSGARPNLNARQPRR